MDCEHLVVELVSRPVSGLSSISIAHWFKCMTCPTKTCVVEHMAVP